MSFVSSVSAKLCELIIGQEPKHGDVYDDAYAEAPLVPRKDIPVLRVGWRDRGAGKDICRAEGRHRGVERLLCKPPKKCHLCSLSRATADDEGRCKSKLLHGVALCFPSVCLSYFDVLMQSAFIILTSRFDITHPSSTFIHFLKHQDENPGLYGIDRTLSKGKVQLFLSDGKAAPMSNTVRLFGIEHG
jgi:hypothetical protein